MHNRLIIASLLAFVLIVLNVSYFTCATDITTANWITYSFAMVAYLWMGIATLTHKEPRSYSWTTLYVPAIYLTWTLLLFVAFHLWPVSPSLCLIIELAVMAIFVVRYVIHAMANKATSQAIARQDTHAGFIQIATSKLGTIEGYIADYDTLKAVRRLTTQIKSCPLHVATEKQFEDIHIISQLDEMTRAASQKKWNAVRALIPELERMIWNRSKP